MTDLLTESFVIVSSLSAESLHRGELEILDEVSDGLGQDVVTPDSSAEHLKQGRNSEKQSNCQGGESCLVFRQVSVGGGVGDQGKFHGQGSSGEWHGDAAVGGAHHTNDGVLLSGLIFLLYL